MNYRIDHEAEAVSCLNQASGKLLEQAEVLIARAQVHALLAAADAIAQTPNTAASTLDARPGKDE